MARDADFERLWGSSLGLLRVWTAHVGRRHGLLAALADAPRTPDALAHDTGLDAGAVRLWCESAHALHLVEREGERYRVTPRMAQLLVQDTHADYLGGQLSYLALRSLDLGALDEMLPSGASAPQPHLTDAYSEATRWDHTMSQRVIEDVPALRERLEASARVLDMGCGTGGWDIALARRFPRARFLGADLDRDAIEEGERRVKEEGLESRIELRAGDGAAATFKREFDLVHLGEVLCRTDDRAGILAACRRALREDGWLIVVEGLLDEGADPRSPDQELVRAMQLEFALQGARFLGRRELREMLRDAGLAVEREVHAGGGVWFVVTRPR